MINTKTTLALMTLVAGLVGFSQAQAGAAGVMLGQSAFENRCDARGGDFSPDGLGYACELENVRISCLFEGADAACEWNGVQNQVEVIRVLGALPSDSLSSAGDGVSKKKKYGKDMMLDLDIQWKP